VTSSGVSMRSSADAEVRALPACTSRAAPPVLCSDRGVGVEAVDLQEVDVAGTQTPCMGQKILVASTIYSEAPPP
jgi:hypothetical protein